MKFPAIVILATTLGSCVTTPPGEEFVWVRTDGQRSSDNPALSHQFEIDKTICLGETQKSAVGMAPIYYQGIAGAMQADAIEGQRSEALKQVAQGCMAGKGYVFVPRSKAQETADRFKATNSARGSLEAKRR